MNTFAYESGHSVRTQAYVFAISFVLGMLVARHLGPSPRGVLSLAQQVFTLGTMLGGLGFHAAVRYWIARSRTDVTLVLARGGALAIIGTVGALIVYGAAYVVFGDGLLAPVPAGVIAMFGLLTAVNVANAFLTAVVYGDGDVLGVNRASMIATTVRAGAIGALLVNGLTIEGVVVAAIAMELVMLGLLVRNARARLGRLVVRPTLRGTSEMARYGVVSMASNVLQWLNYRADIFLLAAMRSEAEVGRYTVAVSLAEILMRGAAAICRPLFPRVARESLSGEVTARASRVAVLAMSAMAVALVLPGYLAHLYLGEAYAGMFAAFLWLLPGTIAYGLGYVLHFDLLARGTVGRLTIANGASLCANIALNIVLIPRYGILGAAWSTSIAYALNLLVVGVMFRAIHGIPLRALWLPGRADAAELRARARGFAGGFGGR